MKVVYVLIFFVCLYALAGCGTVDVFVKPNTILTSKSRITIICDNRVDNIGVQGKLEHILLTRGFEIVSEAVASHKTKYEDKAKGAVMGDEDMKAGMYKGETEISQIKEVKSNYVLKFEVVPKLVDELYPLVTNLHQIEL